MPRKSDSRCVDELMNIAAVSVRSAKVALVTLTAWWSKRVRTQFELPLQALSIFELKLVGIRLTHAWSSKVVFMPLSILFVAVSRKWFSMSLLRRAPSIFFCFSTDRGVVGNVFLSLRLGVRNWPGFYWRASGDRDGELRPGSASGFTI